jgi:Zeta toxin
MAPVRLMVVFRLSITDFSCLDEIRNYLPEYSAYLTLCPFKADKFTRKECGYIAETLLLAALEAGRDAILHCQLRDTGWYNNYIQRFIRQQFPNLKIGLIHIVADEALVKKFSRKRTQNDNSEWRKRFDDKLAQELIQIPNAVTSVRHVVDFFSVIRNRDGAEPVVVQPPNDWNLFQNAFEQVSSLPVVSDDDVGSVDSSVSSNLPSSHQYRRKSRSRKSFNVSLSTEQNYQCSDLKFYGQFAHFRELLDYHYHSNYTKDRQRYQDAIIREFLSATVIKDQHGEICTTPTEPWIVFTAGGM